jgi:hypothetical protein
MSVGVDHDASGFEVGVYEVEQMFERYFSFHVFAFVLFLL